MLLVLLFNVGLSSEQCKWKWHRLGCTPRPECVFKIKRWRLCWSREHLKAIEAAKRAGGAEDAQAAVEVARAEVARWAAEASRAAAAKAAEEVRSAVAEAKAAAAVRKAEENAAAARIEAEAKVAAAGPVTLFHRLAQFESLPLAPDITLLS